MNLRLVIHHAVTAACILSLATAAHAQPAESADWKKRADALFDDSKFAEAYELYEKAYAENPDPALLYNQGRALEAMGDYPEALIKLERFGATAPPALIAKVQGFDGLLEQLRARVATLTVRCNVERAELVVRGKALGSLSARERAVSVRAGAAEVDVRAEGYEPVHRTVDLPPGGVLVLELELKAKAQLGVLAIAAQPVGSQVLVDDRLIGVSPVEARLPSGDHLVIVRRDGYVEQHVPVAIATDARRELDLRLERNRSIVERWYFWAAVGAAVAGGAIAATLLIDGPAEKGSFSPAQVRAPLTVAFP